MTAGGDPWAHANRCISTRLSPWAPGCIDLPWKDRRLRRDYWSIPLAKVVASLLRRLGRAPGEITVLEPLPALIDLHAPLPGDLAPYLSGSGLLASLWGGPSLTQVQGVLDQLAAAGWNPGAWTPPPPPSAAVFSFPASTPQGAPA